MQQANNLNKLTRADLSATGFDKCLSNIYVVFVIVNKVTSGCRGGGALNFFQIGVYGPDFRSVGLANWHLPLKRRACERKISKFGGLWAKIWVKIEAVKAKISKFSHKEVLWTDSFAWNGPLASGRRGVKRGLQGRTSPYPLSRSVPPWSL